jgi:hypothetical protein
MDNQLCSYTRTFQRFMKPYGVSRHPQELTTYPCPGPDQSSKYPNTRHYIYPSILILATHPHFGLPNGLFLWPSHH